MTEPAPQILWRLVSLRKMGKGLGKPIRHTNWFTKEDALKEHSAWIEDGRGEVLSIAKYTLTPPEKP